jgi:hypothetical protein
MVSDMVLRMGAGRGLPREVLALPYPQRKDEILTFVRKHHGSRRSPSVWTIAYALENGRGKIQAVLMYGPPPYPSVTRGFVRCPEHARRLIWQARMVAAGITAAELDAALQFANRHLAGLGYWWVLTLTEATARAFDGLLARVQQRAFTGQVYDRNGFMFCGYAAGGKVEGFVIDGVFRHIRQGRVTLSQRNVREHFPEAGQVRPVRSPDRARWVAVLGDAKQQAVRVLLMRYDRQAWEPARQPRLLARAGDVIGFAGARGGAV